MPATSQLVRLSKLTRSIEPKRLAKVSARGRYQAACIARRSGALSHSCFKERAPHRFPRFYGSGACIPGVGAAAGALHDHLKQFTMLGSIGLGPHRGTQMVSIWVFGQAIRRVDSGRLRRWFRVTLIAGFVGL